MKKLITLALCAACMLVVSCIKDRPKDSTIMAKSYHYFEAVASTASLTADAGIVTLDITANVPWTLKADEGLVPDVTEGSGSASVQIAVPENLSFSARSFSWSVSTDVELDVDDPEQWTVSGRTIDFTLTQDGILPVLSVDASELEMSAMDVSAVVTLTANVEYEIECKSEDLALNVEDDKDNSFCHYLTFSFPANETVEAVEYRAEINPTQTDIPGIVPIEIVIRQDGILPVLSVDASELKVSASDVSAVVTLTATVPYEIECKSVGLSFSVEDDEDNKFCHYLTFSFPANETEEAVEYRAEINPTQTGISGINPIGIVIRQSALLVIHLDCTEASKFKWSSANAFPTRTNKASDAFDFWLSGQTEYVFHGNVYFWSNHLAFASGSLIQLPNISGYSLAEMKITSQYSSKTPKYEITDGTNSLASFSMDKTQLPKTLDVSATPQSRTSPDRYLTAAGEGNIQFILTYVGVE